MKKVLLSLMLVFACVQVSTAGDLPLSLSDLTAWNGNSSFEPTTGKITIGASFTKTVGWEFTTDVNHATYPYLKIVFGTGGNTVPSLSIVGAKGSTEVFSAGIPDRAGSALIAITGDVDNIYFKSNDWQNFPSAAPYPSFILTSATLQAAFATEKIPLPVTDVYGEWWGGFGRTGENGVDTIIFKNGWEFVGWRFETDGGRWGVTGFPDESINLESEEYVGFGLVYEPLQVAGLQFKGTTDAGNDFYGNLGQGSTSFNFALSEAVYRLGFNWDGDKSGSDLIHSGEFEDDGVTEKLWPYLKIKEAYLLKKKIGDNSIKQITPNTGIVDVYTILGVKIRSNVESANALTGLQKGIYIVGGKKVFVTK